MKKTTRNTNTRKRTAVAKAMRPKKGAGDTERGLYLRFEDAPSKEKIRKAAKAAGVSMNRYIVAASTAWAKEGKRLDPVAVAPRPAAIAS